VLRLACGAVEVHDSCVERCAHERGTSRRKYPHPDNRNSDPGFAKGAVNDISNLLAASLSPIDEGKACEPCYSRGRRFQEMPSADRFIVHI
jgi:hypothetical protein